MYGTATTGETRCRPLLSRSSAALSAALLVVLAAGSALAQTTHYVPGDYATIQAAYTAAVAGDEIVVSTGTYNEHDIAVKLDVPLRSETGDPDDVIVDAQELGVVFSIDYSGGIGDAGVEIVGITIANGLNAAEGAIGGGIEAKDFTTADSVLEVRDCLITGCTSEAPGAGGHGGGIGATQVDDVILTDCDFVNNHATYVVTGGDGGGLSVFSAGSLVVTRCDFTSNTADEQGGGVWAESVEPPQFVDCTFTENTSDNRGGAAFVDQGSFTGCIFYHNSSTSAGGGAIAGEVSMLSGCEFLFNRANAGAGGAVHGIVSYATGCYFSFNVAQNGGAARLYGYPGVFEHCMFVSNSADSGDGSAVTTFLTGDYTFTNCTFAINSAVWAEGSSVCVDETSAVTLDKCIVARDEFGVGVECLASGVATLTCTDVFANVGGDWVGCISGQAGSDFNLLVDPLYCGSASPDVFSLRSNSPCAAENNPDCGQIGARGVGCFAEVSSSDSEWDWGTLTAGDDATVCPAGDGPDYIDVYVRDSGNMPIPGAAVSLFISPGGCVVNACPSESWVTDNDGYAQIYPRVGLDPGGTGCCTVGLAVFATVGGAAPVRVLFEGAGFSDSRIWRSYDLNGDGVVNGIVDPGAWGDIGIFESDWVTDHCRSDFNDDGIVNLSDYSIILNHHSNHPALSRDGTGPVDFETMGEGEEDTRQITLRNTGGTALNWQLIETSDLITSISPSSGTLPFPPDAAGSSVVVTVTVNTTGLSGPITEDIDVVSDSSYECLIDDPIEVTVNVPTGPSDRDWDGGGDGITWESSSNWDPDGVPGANDHAHIDLDGDYTVYYNSTSTIHALTHGAASGVQTLDIETGTLGVTDGALNTQTIVVRGDAAFDASAGGDTALVVNEASGTFILDNGDINGSGMFTNRGHLRKIGGLISHVTMDFENELPGRAELPWVSVEAGTLSFEGDTDLNGRMTVNTGGSAIASGHFRIISGEVMVDADGEFVVADTVIVTSTGTLDASGGIVVEPGGLLVNLGDIVIRDSGSLTVEGELTNEADGQLVADGLVYVPLGGLLTNDGYFDLGENAILTGSGTVDNTLGTAAIKGLVAPGDAEGTLTFLGDFVQSPTSEISLEIGGYDQGVTYDLLAVSGLATLDGAVAVTLTNGFEPVVGDTFQTVTHAGAGPGGTSFFCYSGLEVSETVYLDPLHLTGEFVLYATGGATGNANPIAADDAASATGYQPITIDVLANDSDPDLHDLRIILLSTSPMNGVAYINEDDLLVSYAAMPGSAGGDSFDYVVTDCYGGADIGRVRINVTAPPAVWSVPDDSPTIAGALAMAASGDTVLIACGTYYESDVTVPSGVVLMSETGEPDCVTIDASGRAGGGLLCTDADTTTVIRGITVTGGSGVTLGGGLYCLRSSPRVFDCVFDGNAATLGGGVACDDSSLATFVGCRISANVSTAGGGVYCTGGSSASFSQCTVVGNTSSPTGGSGLFAADATHPTLDHTIVAFGIDGEAVACSGTGTATFACSDVFGNAGGDWTGCVSGQGTVDGNFSLEPAFCDTATGDYHLTPASPCADAAGCGLVGALEAGCLSVPDIDVSPLSFTFELSSGATATDSIHISDLGRPSLTWLIRESAASRAERDSRTAPIKARVLASEATTTFEPSSPLIAHVEVAKGEDDPRDGRGPTRGSGGPDAFGYTWIDSDDPMGPSYAWREISGVGTALALTDDDHEEVLLPFTFPFYSELELLVKISSNGYLTFGSDGDDYSNDPIPDPWTPNNVIAPFWDDLNPELGGTVYYYHDAIEGEFIVQYEGLYDYYGEGPHTFEVVLKADGSIQFLYSDITGATAAATVGIEDAYGTAGLEIAFNAAYVTSGLAVLIEDPAPWLVQTPGRGVVPGLGTDSIVLEVDTGDLTAGIYHVTLVIESDDPDEPEIMIPVTLALDVVGVDDELPSRYVLYGNYPNPFNPRTEIRYDLPATATVTLKVYSIAGRLVRSLVDGESQSPGPYRIQWDGKDERGRSVASGVYYYRLEADGEAITSRMVLLK